MNISWKKILVGLWILIAVVGTAGMVNRLLYGHHSAAYGSYIVWGLWVSAYIYFAGLSAGSFLLSSLIYVFGVKKLERIGKLSLFVAIITLIMGLCSIWMDLGKMWRVHRVFTSPNFSSMMAWMIWLYTTYSLLLITEIWFAMRPDLARWGELEGLRGRISRAVSFTKEPLTPVQEASGRCWLKMLGAFGIPLAILFSGGVGALFGTVSARPYWHTPLFPILFLVGALLSGSALIAFVTATFWPNRDNGYKETVLLLGRVVLALLVLDLVLEWAEFSIPMWYGVGSEYHLMKEVLFGKFWWVFWGVHIFFGSVIPIYLLLAKKGKPWAVGLACFLIAATFLAVRLNIVVPGLVEPNLQLLENAFVDHRLKFSYLPSFFEWQVTLFIVAIGTGLFYLGYKYLPLMEERKSS
jgi:molybdopterin-containing oxidoreductase family membrane subunit